MGGRAAGTPRARVDVIEIREATPEDFAAAGEAAVAGYAGFYGENMGSYEEQLRDVASRVAGGAVLVAIDAGEVVGTVTYVGDASSPYARQRDHEASIRMLAVRPSHARRGIGRALSEACIARARADGKRAIVLHADEIMGASRKLYEDLGFRRDPSRDQRIDDGTFLLCYVLDL